VINFLGAVVGMSDEDCRLKRYSITMIIGSVSRRRDLAMGDRGGEGLAALPV
jgi:hypothetical protein